LAGTSRSTKTRKRVSRCLLVLGLTLAVFNAYAAQQITLSWDPQSDSDVQGYGIYMVRGDAGPPYDLYGYVTKGELSHPDTPTFTVANLQSGATYRFAVTAFTAQGAESSFSNQACAQLGDTIVLCAPSSSSASGSDAGGGGGGCFIGAAAPTTPANVWLSGAGALLTLLGGVFGARRGR
jgi:hypothetical protein